MLRARKCEDVSLVAFTWWCMHNAILLEEYESEYELVVGVWILLIVGFGMLKSIQPFEFD